MVSVGCCYGQCWLLLWSVLVVVGAHVKVAQIMYKMAEAHVKGQQLEGIYHWQNNQCLTKYDMVKNIGEIANHDTSHIIPDG